MSDFNFHSLDAAKFANKQYLVIEGIDFTGKTTQFNMLKERIESMKIIDRFTERPLSFSFVNEPQEEGLGKIIRDMVLYGNIPMTDNATSCLFLADRVDLWNSFADMGDVIVTDRSFFTGVAYSQFHYAHGFAMNQMAINSADFYMKKKVVILLITKDELARRIRGRVSDNIEKKGVERLMMIQKRLREGALFYNNATFARGDAGCDILTLDASHDPSFLHNRIFNFFFDTKEYEFLTYGNAQGNTQENNDGS